MSQVPLAPATTLAVFAMLPQEGVIPGGDGVIQLVVQGGLAAILVWIWWQTHQQANKEQERLRGTIGKAFKATRENNRAVRNELMEMQQQHHETQKQLVGVMNRLETKLDKLDE
jgi:hypothetical protein